MSSCAICNSDDLQEMAQQKSFNWHRCGACGYAFIHGDYADEDDLDVLSEDRGGAYLEFYGTKFKKKMRRARKRARLLKQKSPGPRILDVGCNLGYFVEACREIQMQAVGIEVSPPVVEQAKTYFPKSEFICGFLEETNFKGEAFDAVYTSEVIEHVPDINNFMAHIAQNMKSGGALYLTTPELKKFKDTSAPQGWKNLHAPNHRQYFSKDNIVHFLEKHGFERVRLLRNWNFKSGIKVLAYKT